MPIRGPVKAEIDRIRRNVQHDGEGFANCDTLRVLCEDQGTYSHQLDRIADNAEQEGWSFAYLTDGSVRFAPLTGEP